jgi:hypothetical protein
MMSAVSQSLAARTGRSLQEWVALVQASGLDPLDQNAVRGWLRRDRVDLGLRFTDPPRSARLAPATGPGQATHKVSLRGVGDADDEVQSLLRAAYDQNP